MVYITGSGTVEDTGHSDGDSGISILGVRNDTNDTLCSTDLDYSFVQLAPKGQVKVTSVGIISTANSTNTPLAADAVFSGTGESVLNYGSINITSYSDTTSATIDGLVIEFSTDNTNWVRAKVVQSIKKERLLNLTIRPHGQYFRLTYTNGQAAQSAFRLQVIFFDEALQSETDTTLGKDKFEQNQTRGILSGAIQTTKPETLAEADKCAAPLQVNHFGELRTDSEHTRRMVELLENILTELQTNNLHMSMMTDENFSDHL